LPEIARVAHQCAVRGRRHVGALTGEVGIAVFRIAFERWVEETNRRALAELIRESFDEMKALTAEDRRGEGTQRRARVAPPL
jgi:hypothetical protein